MNNAIGKKAHINYCLRETELYACVYRLVKLCYSGLLLVCSLVLYSVVPYIMTEDGPQTKTSQNMVRYR